MEGISLDLMATKSKYQKNHPKAYARDHNATPNGLTKRIEWIIVDPEQGYATVGSGASEHLAWLDAESKEDYPSFI